ncbi:hypothetical protein Tco_1384492 [Tanacetum coccineum]
MIQPASSIGNRFILLENVVPAPVSVWQPPHMGYRYLATRSELFAGAIYAKTASEMWNDLKETYDKVDGSAVFNLHKNVNSLNQNDSTLAD